MTSLPLAGVRALGCAGAIAGPHGSPMLTLPGAETIEAERPRRGDGMRDQGGVGAWTAAGLGRSFPSCDAGERSVTLESNDPRGVLREAGVA